MHSLRHWISGASMEDFPLLCRCLETGQAVCAGDGGHGKQDGFQHSSWRYMVLPVRRSVEGYVFLCVDNPREHFLSIALALVLMRFLRREKKRLENAKINDSTAQMFL